MDKKLKSKGPKKLLVKDETIAEIIDSSIIKIIKSELHNIDIVEVKGNRVVMTVDYENDMTPKLHAVNVILMQFGTGVKISKKLGRDISPSLLKSVVNRELAERLSARGLGTTENMLEIIKELQDIIRNEVLYKGRKVLFGGLFTIQSRYRGGKGQYIPGTDIKTYETPAVALKTKTLGKGEVDINDEYLLALKFTAL
jgi:hypothetical protein